jgi:hypothetical protein
MEGLAAEFHGLAGGAWRSEEAEAGDGEIAAFHDAEHFDSDGSGCADDCDSVGFRHSGIMSGKDLSPQHQGNALLRVDVASQMLLFFENGEEKKRWPVSTSRFGLGFEEGSFKTPTGRFVVAEKFGEGSPLWSEFKSRQPTGRIAAPGGEADGVLTRILWLDGLDEENANTRGRYIYFHGTNREDLIGTPASHGCVRLKNTDMVEVFDLVPEGAMVVIA